MSGLCLAVVLVVEGPQRDDFRGIAPPGGVGGHHRRGHRFARPHGEEQYCGERQGYSICPSDKGTVFMVELMFIVESFQSIQGVGGPEGGGGCVY